MKRSNLLATLDLMRPALSTKDLVPVFKAFCFNKGTVSAYNDTLGITAPCDVSIKAGLSGDVLLSLLSSSRAKTVAFNVDGDVVAVKAGKTRMRLPYFTSDEFLFEEPEDNWATGFNINKEVLSALECCLLTASQDTAMPALMGIAINFGKTVTFYSCDGDALSRYQFKMKPHKLGDKGLFIIPYEFCQAVLKIAGKLSFEKGEFKINQDWAKVIFPKGFVLYGRIIEPDKEISYEDLIKDSLGEEKLKFIKVPMGMVNALSRASVIVDKDTMRTDLSVEENRLKFYTESHMGVVRDSMKIEEDHETIKISVNPELIHRALKVCDEFSFLENCTVLRNRNKLLQIIGNLD